MRRAAAVAGEIALGLAGLVWIGQGLGLVRVVRSFMVDQPEWIAIGLGTFVLALALLWRTLHAARVA